MTQQDSRSLKIAIADDESLSLLRLGRCLEKSGCTVVGKFADGATLVDWLQGHDQPDALFIDVKMPGASGLDILAEYSTRLPIVLVTSGAEFAVPAFDFEATDFLLKPFSQERIEKALERVRKQLGVAQAASLAQPAPRIPVLAGTGTLLLEVAKISHFKLERAAVWACTASGEFQTRWRSLNQVLEALPGVRLIRLNRTVVARPEGVRGLRVLRYGKRMILLADGREYIATRMGTRELNRILGLQ
ncbi:hypothetical protein METESE_23870 [Mesoterricola sediminis]|uniref:Response regulatory domain-containing protein n=2 Tax=Mesoterricola sediminis TaxID=2927980 RepID=A0AA48GW82_9BACT|nr:hypothetical protein METESE_23870 [Mesoterricola sediminis]